MYCIWRNVFRWLSHFTSGGVKFAHDSPRKHRQLRTLLYLMVSWFVLYFKWRMRVCLLCCRKKETRTQSKRSTTEPTDSFPRHVSRILFYFVSVISSEILTGVSSNFAKPYQRAAKKRTNGRRNRKFELCSAFFMIRSWVYSFEEIPQCSNKSTLSLCVSWMRVP